VTEQANLCNIFAAYLLGLAFKLAVCNNGQSSLKTHMADKRRRSGYTAQTQNHKLATFA